MDFRTGNISDKLPLVTIGLSSYNYSKYIEDALDSLIAQTYPYIELIIIDDCSVDDSPQKIESWIKRNNITCTYICHVKNLGITKTSNEFVAQARGKYLVLFASDDIMRPKRITEQINIIEAADDSYGLCYSPVLFMDEDGKAIEYPALELKKTISGFAISEFIRRDFGFLTPSALIRLEVYNHVGVYDERVLIEDYNFFIRLLGKYKVIYCDYPGLIYRIKVKNTSPVFELADKNNRERYYAERIISNMSALKFLSKREDRLFLEKKNIQYLKTLAANNSGKFWPGVLYCLKKGQYKLPPVIFITKISKYFYSIKL